MYIYKHVSPIKCLFSFNIQLELITWKGKFSAKRYMKLSFSTVGNYGSDGHAQHQCFGVTQGLNDEEMFM